MPHLENKGLATEFNGLLLRAEAVYKRALAVIKSNVPDLEPGFENINTCLARLDPLMRQTQEIDRELAPCRQRWLQSGLKPDAALQLALARHQQLLGELIQKINFLESRMQQLKAVAVPAVDSFVRHQQMQKAYQQSSK